MVIVLLGVPLVESGLIAATFFGGSGGSRLPLPPRISPTKALKVNTNASAAGIVEIDSSFFS